LYTLSDSGILTGNVVTVQTSEPIDHIVCVLKCVDVTPAVVLVAHAKTTISGSTSIVCDTEATFSAGDSLRICYVVQQS
jgi:hypothetical protein